jgi:hypothetical protein
VRGYFGALREMELSLMKQVAALEDAGIVGRDAAPAGAPPPAAAGDAPANRPPTAGPPAAEGVGSGSEGAAGGGLGALDVAWLNSRARDVGLERERELVAEAKARLGRRVRADEGMEGVVEETSVEDDVPVKEEAMDLAT